MAVPWPLLSVPAQAALAQAGVDPPASAAPDDVVVWVLRVGAGVIVSMATALAWSWKDRLSDWKGESKEWQEQSKAATTATSTAAAATERLADRMDRHGELLGSMVRQLEGQRESIERLERAVADALRRAP